MPRRPVLIFPLPGRRLQVPAKTVGCTPPEICPQILQFPHAPGNPPDIDQVQRPHIIRGGASAHRAASQRQSRRRFVDAPTPPRAPGVFTKSPRYRLFAGRNSRITCSFSLWITMVCPIPSLFRISIERRQASSQPSSTLKRQNRAQLFAGIRNMFPYSCLP